MSPPMRTFTWGGLTMKRNAKRGMWGVLGVAAAAVAGVFIYRGIKNRLPEGAQPKPPAVRPGETIPDIPYVAGGESFLTLPVGSEFRVVWDPTSSVHYQVQDTASTDAAAFGDGFVRFRQVVQLPSTGVSQVFVIATDENDNVLSEHKVTVFGPG